MSNRQICREKYYSYASYLNSRGYDREICNLVQAIETGQIPLGPITPAGACGVTIKGTTTIQNCGDTSLGNNYGILKVLGGADTSPNLFSITANHGINMLGPIFQNYGTDISYSVGSAVYHGNYFSANEHIFTDHDASTNVYIRGNLYVQGGAISDLSSQDILESVTINTLTGFDGNSLRIYHSPAAVGNIIRVDLDVSSVAASGAWERYLGFAVDGSDNQAGSTDADGHVRALRGMTITNPPPAATAIDISYDTNWLGTGKALDVYGGLFIGAGNNGASASLDISAGTFQMLNGDTVTAFIQADGDASFNHTTVYDLSIINTFQVGTSSVHINSTTVDAPNIEAIDASFTSMWVNDLSINGTLDLPSSITFNSITAADASFSSIWVNDLSINGSIVLPPDTAFSTISATDASFVNLYVRDDLSANSVYAEDISALVITLDRGTGGVDTIITGDVIQVNALGAEGAQIANTLLATDISCIGLTGTDASLNNLKVGVIGPDVSGVFGISYEAIGPYNRTNYLFGQGFALGDFSGQEVTLGSYKYSSQYLTVGPSQLKINALGNADMITLGDTGDYLVLDVSGHPEDYFDSVIDFNGTLEISGADLTGLTQSCLFLHPGTKLEIGGNGDNYWPSVANGDIILDTRSVGTLPAGILSATVAYGNRMVFTGSTLPTSSNILPNNFYRARYVPTIAFNFQNNGQSVTINSGNLSMHQTTFK